MNPILSVVMPAKNTEKFIKKTLDSLINQSFKDWELIFIDDHSEDKTAEIVKNNTDKRIKYFFLEKGTGIPAGRHFGNIKARGKIIVIADSDDFNHPDRLKTIFNEFKKNPSATVFYSNIDINYIEENRLVPRPFQEYNLEILKKVNYIANSAAAYKKKAYFEIGGYDQSLKMCEDYDLWLRFALNGLKFIYSPKSLVILSRYVGSTTGTKKHLLRKYIHEVKEKYHLPVVADISEFKKMVSSEVFQYFTTPGGIKLWFS